MQISPILLGGLILGMTLFGQAFAQSTGGDTSVTIDEELVHRMVNGTFVIERQPVQITTIVMPPSATGTGESDTRPWHVIRGFESKINPLLQLEIDNKKKICTYELIFDDCPPLDRNADGEEIINAYILLQEIELWPNGWPNPDKYPTDEQKDKRRAEKNKEVAMSQQPFIEFLESNNQTVMHRFELINAISADITIDFLSQLEAMDEVIFIESRNTILQLQLLESKQITGIEQTKRQLFDGGTTTIAIMDSRGDA